MKILVIGNGSIGIHKNQQFFINNHTGNFLLEMNKKLKVTFCQGISKYIPNSDLQNFDLASSNINYACIKSSKNPLAIIKLAVLILNSDFVYIFSPGTVGRIVGLLSIILRKKFGLYIRGQYFDQYKFDKFILRNAQFILTVSPLFIKALSKFCKNIDVIKPMISIRNEDINKGRSFNKPKKWNLLFIGRVEYRKGIEELFQIAKILKERELIFELNIVGGGDLYAKKLEQIEEQGLSENIKLHGQIADKKKLMELYSNANVFVFTSHDEGFPRVLYEAMASALPIFTTFVGGIAGRMKNGVNCIKIPVRDGNSAAEIISNNIINSEILEKIGINGQVTLLDIINGGYLPHDELLLKNLEND